MLEHHERIIVGQRVVADDWQVLRLEEGDSADSVVVPAGKVMVPLAVWQAQEDSLAARTDIGVWFGADERAEVLKGQLERFAVIGVDFPKFTDGRGYSTAFNLRKRLGYVGQLRAIGDVLRDQLFSMRRVGFDAYATRPDRSIDDAVKGLTDFSETYQASVDQPLPLFRRVERVALTEAPEHGAGI
ncbi:DUF934 domain-containing protein [Massilia sp. PWRC2]|uniref:DUF934 domain-containing protein n=1 Tax=Massilia sp. PWRC2 TaxID=2804626 RepID=UPI003CF8A807